MPSCWWGSLWSLWNLGIQQLGKARVVGHALEVVVNAGLEAIFLVQFDGLAQVQQAVLGASGHRVQQRKPIKGVVGLGMGAQNTLKLLASFFVVAGVQLRDGIVVVLLGRQKRETALLQLPTARGDVHLAAFLQLDGRSGAQLLEGSQRLI